MSGSSDRLVLGRHWLPHAWKPALQVKPQLVPLQVAVPLRGGLHGVQALRCGHSWDLSPAIAERAAFHADNCYYLPNALVRSYRCKTHTVSNTAFRGFGGPQGMIITETIMGDIARHLGLDPLDVRLRNLYSDELTSGSADSPPAARNTTHYGMQVEDNILLPLLSKLELSAHYRRAQEAIFIWNSSNPVIRRGIAITPVKFGISFTATHYNQAGALLHVYSDGTALLNHGGTEMGQGLFTKVQQAVSYTHLTLPTNREV